MREKIISLFIITVGIALWFKKSPSSAEESISISKLFYNSYKLFELQRNELGVYRDSKLLDPDKTDFHPCSVANVGIGLISLCIADAMGWADNAEEQVLVTLKSMNGHNPPFRPARNRSGFFRHFINMETGKREWRSEYSTIDTGILMCGALFSKKYFSSNEHIADLVQELWFSIDWSEIFPADEDSDGIYMTMDDDGKGIPGIITRPYNEYIIIAWLAMKAEEGRNGRATKFWNRHFADPNNLTKIKYEDIELLTDNPRHYLSTFTVQFPYYLCHYFSENKAYLQYFENARIADSLWFQSVKRSQDFEWGSGAGSVNFGHGYHADAIKNNPSLVVSPHIVAGFLPTSKGSLGSLKAMINDGKYLYYLPTKDRQPILWRKSLKSPDWKAEEVQGIDFSTMLFGLASLEEFLTPAFFFEHNDYDLPPY